MPKASIGDILRFHFRKHLVHEADERSDGELLKQFAATRENAPFTVLFERHGAMVMGICRRILGDFHQAEDCFQATFHVLARNACSIRSGSALGPWLAAVARRVAVRAKVRRAAQRERERRFANIPRTGKIAEGTLLDLSAVLDEEIGRLPEKYRAPLILSYLESKSHNRIAKELGWAEGTVVRRLERGRELLRLQLIKRGISLSAGALATALADTLTAAPIPAMLAINTIKAATTYVAGQATAGGYLSAQAVILAEEVMRGMLLMKAKMVLAALAVSLVVGGGGWAGYKALSGTAPTVQAGAKGREVVKANEATDLYGDPLPAGAAARLGTVRFRYDGGSRNLAFTPDGKNVVMTTNLGVHLWDTATGKELYRLPLNTATHTGTLAVSPDGTILAVAERSLSSSGKDLKVILFERESGRIVRTLLLPDEKFTPAAPTGIGLGTSSAISKQINNLCFSPDGKNLAISLIGQQLYSNQGKRGKAIQGKAYVFDVASGNIHSTLAFENHYFEILAFSSKRKALAAAVYNNPAGQTKHTLQLQLWDIETKKLIDTLHQGPEIVNSLAFSPNGKWLAVGTDKELFLIDQATGKMLQKAGKEAIQNLAFTPDSKKLVANDLSGTVQIWEAATLKVLQTFKTSEGPDSSPSTLALSPNGKTIALCSLTDRVQLWDLATEKRLFTEYQGHDSRIDSLAFSPDGKTLASAGADEDGAFLWDVASRRQISILPGRATGLSYSPDGKHLALVEWNKARIWELAGSKNALEITVFPGVKGVPSGTPALVFSPDSRRLFTLDWTDPPEISGQPLAQVGNIKRFLRHWDLATSKQVEMWPLPEKRRSSITNRPDNAPTIAPNGKTVFLETDMAQFKSETDRIPLGSSIDVYDVESGNKRMLRGPKNELRRLFIPSPDSRLLAVAIDITTKISGIRLWEIMTGKDIFFLEGHANNYASPTSSVLMAWSNDGRLLAAGTRINFDIEGAKGVRLWVWDSATGKELARFDNLPAKVSALAFSPDGRHIAAGMSDTTILLFDVGKKDPKLLPSPKLAKDDLEARWTDLAGDNATLAHQAIGALVLAPKDSVPFLQNHLKPVAITDPAKIQQWVADLNSEVFAVRQTASKELANAGDQVLALLQKAMQANPTLETRRRLEQILKAITELPNPATVRTVRAIMVLERISSPEAQALLETMARGAPRARETREARESLERLTGKSYPLP